MSATEQKKHQEREREYKDEISKRENQISELEKKFKELIENGENLQKQMGDAKMQLVSAQALKISLEKREERLRAALDVIRHKWEQEIDERAIKKSEELFGQEKTRLQSQFKQEVERKVEEMVQSKRKKMDEEIDAEREKILRAEREKVENEIARLKEEFEKQQKDVEGALAAYLEMKQRKEEAERLCSAQAAQLSFVRKEVEKLQDQMRQKLAKNKEGNS